MEEKRPLSGIAGDAREYVDLKIDEVKLKAVDGLSASLSRILASLVLVSIFVVALTLIAFGFVLLLGQVIGSYAAGAFILGAVFAVVFVILYCQRKKLFRNGFVKLFADVFFGNGDEI